MSDDYKDIISLPRHISKYRRPMEMAKRAAQFAPFAALAGFEEEISEVARLTEARADIADHQEEIISRNLSYIKENIGSKPEATLTYFKEDDLKEGGSYISLSGRIKEISQDEKVLIFEDGTKVRIADLVEVNI